ncbi:hypothetical protein DM860_001743 [Cuscuta australis]|uniref:Myb-like domain-containing protein n=1 Tax=Cuscuta australis TaxID=267555 RepID=A0A328E978_9ASTE|nr:hypothetical protein DM860_001743 [Cuscuta australis]
MAAESNMGFHQQQAWSFQPSEMIPIGNLYGHHGVNLSVYNSNCISSVGGGGGGGVLCSGNLSMITGSHNSPGMSQAGTSSPPFLIDTFPGLRHDNGLAMDWSVEEQYKLEEGLVKFANEPNIMKYIKIAATLREKTVRDVAMRCRWVKRKRRKHEDYNIGKKVKDKKDKAADSSLKNGKASTPSNLATYSPAVDDHDRSNCVNSGALLGSRNLLEENNQALEQISANLSTYKLQDNIDLFFRTKNNITAILNEMGNMHGIMSHMPPLPVYLDEELASSILPNSTQSMMFGSSSVVQPKHEPGC